MERNGRDLLQHPGVVSIIFNAMQRSAIAPELLRKDPAGCLSNLGWVCRQNLRLVDAAATVPPDPLGAVGVPVRAAQLPDELKSEAFVDGTPTETMVAEGMQRARAISSDEAAAGAPDDVVMVDGET